MAISPSHRLGQAIGYMLEKAMTDRFRPIAEENNLYLDFCHPRAARNGATEVRWTDIHDNAHKLDIVIERHGSEEQIGSPVAFIEIAWRRYAKHAKNKAQEISGAILPIVQAYKRHLPFYGAIVAGDFTESSLTQLRSEGFQVLHIRREIIEHCFDSVGLDIRWDENTSDDDLERIYQDISGLAEAQIQCVIEELFISIDTATNIFIQRLSRTLTRSISDLSVSVFYGYTVSLNTIEDACRHIVDIQQQSTCEFKKIEIIINYTTGERFCANFFDSTDAIRYLRTLEN